MVDVLKRTGWLVAALALVIYGVMLSSITAHALVPEIENPGMVKLGDVELTGVDPGMGSEDDLVLDTCDATLNYFGFEAGESRLSTVTFHNITQTPLSVLESPATPQFFKFTGSGDLEKLAGSVTYPLVLSGPAVDGLGYHIRLVVTVDAPLSSQIPNTVYKTFWIPEDCEAEPPVVPPVVPEEPTPGVVASATTTTPTPATPASLPATGSSDVFVAALATLVAGCIATMSLVIKRAIVTLT